MGRRSHGQALSIWANGERVGTWHLPARGAPYLQYERDWMASDLGRPLSLSLPFGVDDTPLKGERVQNYFDNLLPDSREIRARIAGRFRTGSVEPFDLLKAIGRDCVGALQFLTGDDEPHPPGMLEGKPVGEPSELLRVRAAPAEPLCLRGEHPGHVPRPER